METIKVGTASRSYEVLVGTGILDRLGEFVRASTGCSRCCVITESTVGPLYADVAEDAAETDTIVALGKTVDVEDVMKRKAARKSLSFAEKYALSDEIVKERYAVLKEALTTTPKGTPKIKSRISRQCDTYRRNGDIVAKITIIGGSLRINLPLDPDAPEFNDGKMPHTATGHKKVYAEVPFQFKVNSKLALKRALRLIEMVK